MPRVVIVEDEQQHTDRLVTLLRDYQEKHPAIAFEIKCYNNPHRFLAEYACDADIIFLDIQMPNIDGMTVAKKIRAIDNRVMLIFTTALAQYAIAGYEVQAFDYILKPLGSEIFEVKLTRALRVLEANSSEEWIDISTKTETRRIPVSQVTYIEVDNHDILIHSKGAVFRHWGSLREYEQRLCGMHFARCNTCYLVNLKFVQCIQGDRVQVADDMLSISRSRRKEFLIAFAKYKGGN